MMTPRIPTRWERYKKGKIRSAFEIIPVNTSEKWCTELNNQMNLTRKMYKQEAKFLPTAAFF